MRRRTWIAILCASAAPALAQTPTVQVVGERSAVSGCEMLGTVRGSSLMGMILENAGWENTVDEMKQRALELGGTHLLLREVKNGFVGSNGWGEVFGCRIPAPAPRRGR